MSKLPHISSVLVIGLVALSACTPAPEGGGINDPYESANRQVHAFNKALDTAVLRPAGQSVAALPPEVTGMVTNFADNVGLPGAVVNGALQGDIGGVAQNTMRFVINTTVGIGGLFDPADTIGLTEKKTDFGQTLHVWGVPEGAYVELPLLGPSTERDAVGEVVDLIMDPLGAVGTQQQLTYGTGSRIADIVISRGRFGSTFDSVLYESADSYAQTRVVYLDNRHFELGIQADDAYMDPYADPYFDPYQDQ